MRHEQDRWGSMGPGKSQEPSAVEERGGGEDCNVWLDFLPESAAFAVKAGGEGGSYSSAQDQSICLSVSICV